MTSSICVSDAEQLITRGEAVLIDVREPDEFKTEHIAYALSIPLNSLESSFTTLSIPSSKTILFQCFKGSRGQLACDRIQGLASCQNKIMNIDGGIEAWKALKLPVIGMATTPPTISIMRQVQIIVGFLVAICVVIGFAGVSIGFVLAGVFGAALFVAGISGWCGMALLLAKMQWNK